MLQYNADFEQNTIVGRDLTDCIIAYVCTIGVDGQDGQADVVFKGYKELHENWCFPQAKITFAIPGIMAGTWEDVRNSLARRAIQIVDDDGHIYRNDSGVEFWQD